MEAMQKFWVNEDLLEHLMPMMDLPSTLALASVNPLVQSVTYRYREFPVPGFFRFFGGIGTGIGKY